jgi:hypothetical protein
MLTHLSRTPWITVTVHVEYKLISSSPCNFLQPVASPLNSVLRNHLHSPLTVKIQVSPHIREQDITECLALGQWDWCIDLRGSVVCESYNYISAVIIIT